MLKLFPAGLFGGVKLRERLGAFFFVFQNTVLFTRPCRLRNDRDPTVPKPTLDPSAKGEGSGTEVCTLSAGVGRKEPTVLQKSMLLTPYRPYGEYPSSVEVSLRIRRCTQVPDAWGTIFSMRLGQTKQNGPGPINPFNRTPICDSAPCPIAPSYLFFFPFFPPGNS